jgi:ABC-type phosphate transport system substrate-binding protein
MRELFTALVAALALLALVAAAVPVHAGGPLDLAVIVNPQTRAGKMSAVEMETVFTRTQTRWDNGAPIVPINAPPGSDMRIAFDRAVLQLDPDAVGRFWIDRRIRGLGLPPRHVADPASVVRVVEKLVGAIGYTPEALVTGAKVNVVARIRQGKVLPP